MRIYASAAYVSLILFASQTHYSTFARSTDDARTNTVISSEENYAIDINLNINLNGNSNDSEEIVILDEPKSLVKSRSLSGTQSRTLVLSESGTETDRLTGSQILDWAASQKAETLERKLKGLEALEILDLMEKETGKKFSPTDRNKATEAVKKVINNKKRSGARGIFTTIAAIISGIGSLIAVLNQLS